MYEEALRMLKQIFMMTLCVSLFVVASAIGFTPAPTTAQAQRQEVFNAPNAIQLTQVITGLSSTVFVTHAHDGTNRLFIIEQAGRIRVAHPGASSTTVFLDI